MQGHLGREEPPHRASAGRGEETPCRAWGLFAERALEGTKWLQGTACPKGQPYFPPAEPGQASLLPVSSGPRDDKCLPQTCFAWVDGPPVLGTTTSLRGPDTPRGEADRAQLSDPEITTKHKTCYSSLIGSLGCPAVFLGWVRRGPCPLDGTQGRE